MANNLGFGSLIISLFLALYCFFTAVVGGWRKNRVFIKSARLGVQIIFGLVSISISCLVYLLVRGHFDVHYVYTVTGTDLPVHLRITALWGGKEGSFLIWSWVLALIAMLASGRERNADNELQPWVLAVFALNLAFFISLSLFFENPFSRMWQLADGSRVAAMTGPEGAIPWIPQNGNGLNPLLRHPGMIYHPPLLYLGFAGFTVPFAFCIAALISGHMDGAWIRHTRRWTLFSWLFLSLGLLFGSRWAYDVLGWGGYWGWDPVETAALLPWLTGTAYLHMTIAQEKAGLYKRWNVVLIILTYGLVNLGIFLTRSGILSSVHAYSQSAIGSFLGYFLVVSLSVPLDLLVWRWKQFGTDIRKYSIYSREVMFLFAGLLFMAITGFCLWGILQPILADVSTGQTKIVSPEYYKQTTSPLFAALMLLMGIAPLSAWGYSTWKTLRKGMFFPVLVTLLVVLVILIAGVRSLGAVIGLGLIILVINATVYEYGRSVRYRCRKTGEPVLLALWKLADSNRRRYGGYIIHLGVVLMALGIVGVEMFQEETRGTIARGQALSLGQYEFVYRDLAVFNSGDGRNIARAAIQVLKNGKEYGDAFPRRDYYYESQQPVTVPGILSSLEEDLYIVLVGWESVSSQGATFMVYRNPLINWLWIGGFVIVLGTLVAGWPVTRIDRERAAHIAARMSATGGHH